MNPFSKKGTLSSLKCSCTNIRSLSTTVPGATRSKITRILDLNCDLNILIDTRTSIEDVEKIFLNHKMKWKLAQFKHIGTYTKQKGIIIFFKPSIVQIKDLQIIVNGQLVNFKAKANNDWVNFTTM